MHDRASEDEDIVIEIAFADFPDEIEIEEGVKTSFKEEMLLDKDGYLRIRKVFPRNNLTKPEIFLITWDFADDFYSNLVILKESELNKRCKEKGIDVKKLDEGLLTKIKENSLGRRHKVKGFDLLYT